MEIIELSGLGVRFGKREILSDLRATLSSRSIGLLGPNGAGKSTLIQALLGFCPISSGTASILGLDVTRDRNRIRSLIGYMPENDALIANMTAVSMVRMMGELSWTLMEFPPSHRLCFLRFSVEKPSLSRYYPWGPEAESTST